MATYGYTFTSGDTVTPTKLNNARTVTDIVNADIKSDAAIVGTKISPNFGSQNVTTTGTTTTGVLSVTGNTTLGDADTDSVTINSTVAAGVVVSGSSAGAALRITQTGAGDALLVEDSANPDSSPVVVDASGNTVVGHTAVVSVGGSSQPLTVVGLGASLARAAANAFGAVLMFCKSRSTAIDAARAIVQSGDELGAIEFAADNGANLSVRASSISSYVDGTPGSADMPGRLVFSTTADGSTAPTERMRITNAGDVGIGKTPTTKLDVDGTVTAPLFVGNLTGTASAIADSTVTNAKVATGAAIAHNKLANITAGQVLLGNASNVPTATELTGDVTVSSSGVTAIGAGVIVNADVSASAAIADTKLATISTAGKVANSATTATSANTASAIVARDGSGNFTAGTITATGINLGETTLTVYEEGTFTPTITSGYSPVAYTEQYGNYTRIGNRCFFQIRLQLNPTGTSTTSTFITIAGLPFTNPSGANNSGICAYYMNAAAAGGLDVRPVIMTNTTTIRLYTQTDTGLGNLTGQTAGTSMDIVLAGNYRVA